MPVSQILTMGIKEGKTLDDLRALWEGNLKIANELPGVLLYSIAADEASAAAKKIVIRESFATLAAHMDFAAKLGEAGQMGGIMEIFDFGSLTSMVSGEPLTDEYKKFIEPFGGLLSDPAGHTWIVHDFPSKGD